ncbi:MAG: cysteate synthase, partial [Candidatus Eremiobacteraeota bacterium]|nr:cysteate synthase [Candidatus Eremiobacteraeota bacterium]
MSPSYLLRCTACGAGYQDDGVRLHCDGRHARALLRTEYAQRTLAVDETAGGILRYEAWLPHRNEVEPSGSTAIYRSDALGDFLDLQNLWIAFNGYWPARGATLPSATFKDIEADAIVGRFPRDGRVLVVASAGNTAAALAQACSRYDVPAVVVVPEQALERLRLTAPLAPNVKVVAIGDDSTYDDAIAFAERVAQLDGFVFEGGTFNVARRDGIGTTLLAFSEAAGALPDYYVQAIGSGAGAIAAHEAALRLIEDGRYGARLPRLLLVQNAPSAPVYEAWRAKSESLIEEATDELTLRRRARGLAATVLGTRVPPYGIAGGIRSILTESGGDVVVATNEQACDA